MKTAISVPDETFTQVEQSAKSLGVTRSEFYTRAARFYLDHLEQQSLTSEINAALDGIDESNAVAAAVGRRHLADVDDEW
ncbi:CopG family transcriptional regulator [Kibdelosporangium philippinense]|uniref:CopG family transcriptional regulator n=1 Tax=Kibdelosporangium philippinense TaxID=211113 RepID=A0ABS8ZIT1_9PSEU|nr:CopG family transcriptional regulator [Kibdelosporangium philippinense]MCE7007686.1 CopG family transcriptional regulator [Kibdelosporangium philippinense]